MSNLNSLFLAMSTKKSANKSKSDNDKRSIWWCIKIHIPFDNPLWYPSFESLSLLFPFFAYIKHDSDFAEVLGGIPENVAKSAPAKLAPAHYHFVCKTFSRTYFNPIKEKLQSVYNLDGVLITVEKCLNLTKALRYLCHLDNPEKHLYNINDVVTNDFSFFYENLCLSVNAFTEYLLNALEACNGDYAELVRDIGLDTCKKYHNIIYMYFHTYYKEGINKK